MLIVKMNLLISTLLLAMLAIQPPSLHAKTHSHLHLNKGSKIFQLQAPYFKHDSIPSQYQTVSQIANSKLFPDTPPKVDISSQINNHHLNQPRDSNPRPIHCVDENNRPVDWIIFYKLPRVHGSPNPLIVNGEAYMYVSSEDVKRFEEKKNSAKKVEVNGDNNENKQQTETEHFEGIVSKNDGIGKLDDSKQNKKSRNMQIDLKKMENDKKKKVDKEIRVQSNKIHEQDNNNDQIDKRRDYASNTADDVTSGEQKNLMDKLKIVLMKQFVRDAREQIDMEKGHASDLGIEDQAKLLESELKGSSRRRKAKRDTDDVDYSWNTVEDDMVFQNDDQQTNSDNDESAFKTENANENPHLELDFSDSIRILNNLLQARTSRGSKHPMRNPNVDVRNGDDLKPEDFFEIFRAIELLNDNSEVSDYSEETGGVDAGGDSSTGEPDVDLTSVDEYRVEKYAHPKIQSRVNVATAAKVGANADKQSEHSLEDSSSNTLNEHIPEEIPSVGEKLHWTVSNHSVRDPSSLPGKILSPFLFNESYAPEFSKDGLKILYNDQTPNSTTVKFGHSKGLVLGNSDGGIWIVHSVPHFVDDAQKEYSYPHTGLMYGQNFLCLSLNRTELDYIGNNLGHNQVYKYSTYMSESNKALYPTLAAVVDGTYATSGENYFRSTIHTRFDAVQFQTFAKTRELDEDLYANIARDLNTNLLVETWPNGPGRLRSDCKQPGRLVENVEGINASGVVAFHSTHDHAKWTISFGGEMSKQNSRKIGEDSERQPIGEDTERKTGVSSEGPDFSSNTETIVDESLQNRHLQSRDDLFKEVDDDANELSNEIDPIPHNSLEATHDLNTELSDAEEGVKTSDDSMGEMELIAHRLLHRNYDLDSNMNNLDTMDDAAVQNDDVHSETVKGISVSNLGIIREPTAKTDNDADANIEISKRSVERRDGFDKLSTHVDDFTSNLLDVGGNEAAIFNSNSDDRVGKISSSGVQIGESPRIDDGVGYFVCNGDINRAEDQLKRGGGSVCIDNEEVWGLYHSLVSAVEPCPQG